MLIVLGLINLLVRHRSMFILNGIALIVVALLNLASGGTWSLFGLMQISWGIGEMRKFGQYQWASNRQQF